MDNFRRRVLSNTTGEPVNLRSYYRIVLIDVSSGSYGRTLLYVNDTLRANLNSSDLVYTGVPNWITVKIINDSSSSAAKFTAKSKNSTGSCRYATITISHKNGGESATITVVQDKETYPLHYGVDYVTIGGRKFSRFNVGSSSYSDFGYYFRWGETSPIDGSPLGSTDSDWAEYIYLDSSYPGYGNRADYMIKYNSTDHLTTLQSSDDAVTTAWGGNWRTPYNGLISACFFNSHSNPTTIYGSASYNNWHGLLTLDPDTSDFRFTPALKYGSNGYLEHIWTNSLTTYDTYACVCAKAMMTSNSGDLSTANVYRCAAMPVMGTFDNNA